MCLVASILMSICRTSDQRLLFYEKRACVSAPPWAGSYSAISTGRSRGEHLFFPVQLDGREVSAIIDTGAQRTTVSTSAARALGITEDLLEQDRPITTHGATAEQLASHIHQFKQLEVGGRIIPHPQLVVSDVRLQDAGIVLGADLLRSMRIFVSYASLEIFLSK
jgi:predicted aspartyl protease